MTITIEECSVPVWKTSDGMEFRNKESAEKHVAMRVILDRFESEVFFHDMDAQDIVAWFVNTYDIKVPS